MDKKYYVILYKNRNFGGEIKNIDSIQSKVVLSNEL